MICVQPVGWIESATSAKKSQKPKTATACARRASKKQKILNDLKNLMKIRDLLSDESRWAHDKDKRNGLDGRDKNNKPICPFSPDAVKWTLAGALRLCYRTKKRSELLMVITKRLGNEYNPWYAEYDIQDWNDDPKRTFSEVRQLVEELDI